MNATSNLSSDIAARTLRERWKCKPTMAIITGSGFQFQSSGHVLDTLAYGEVPGMRSSSVKGHDSALRLLDIGGQSIVLCSGRLHMYEGYNNAECLQLVSVLHGLGVSTLLITNAAGGLHWKYKVGDIAMVTDTIDFTFGRQLANAPTQQEIDASAASARLQTLIMDRCTEMGLALHSGTYCQVTGPSYETRAEIRMLRKIGADLVGMSTVRELRKATALGMKSVAFSMVTNTLTDTVQRSVSHEEVLDVASQAGSHLQRIIECCLHVELS